MFKILGAKNRQKNLLKHPGPPFQIRGGPGSFSNAKNPTTCNTLCVQVLERFRGLADLVAGGILSTY